MSRRTSGQLITEQLLSNSEQLSYSPTRPAKQRHFHTKNTDMISREIEIINKLGLHARASAKLTQLAGKFQSEVWMSRNQKRVNAKSIMGVMMLAAGMGSTVTLETEGPDEQAAMDALIELIGARFGESE